MRWGKSGIPRMFRVAWAKVSFDHPVTATKRLVQDSFPPGGPEDWRHSMERIAEILGNGKGEEVCEGGSGAPAGDGGKGRMKIAVVHEWLTVWAGAERVLGEILGLYQQADLYVLFDRLHLSLRAHLPKDPSGETFLGRIPGIEKIYRNLLPLMPFAIESLDLSGYDLILSSSHVVAKGILTSPGQVHLCYCHTPPRYLWDMTEAYFPRTPAGRAKRAAASLFLPTLRRWDLRAGQRPDAFMANSRFVARRIKTIYGRSSTVIPPPVDIHRFVPKTSPGGEYFVTMGRLVPYKNIDRIVEAFRGSPHRLLVIGDGPGRKRIESLVRGQNNMEWIPWISDKDWGGVLQKARAFLFMAEEDFGITPVEAQAAGVPVIALGRGGALETVIGREDLQGETSGRGREKEATGLFFPDPTPESLRKAIDAFIVHEDEFRPEWARRNAERFGTQVFRERYREFVSAHVRNPGPEESWNGRHGNDAR
ncbi:hypothetical protein BOX30_03605 [Leptospirillum ferriphilum]|nr:hypothetical protein BOX30_03605 [Leptospirillum ferriphilum]